MFLKKVFGLQQIAGIDSFEPVTPFAMDVFLDLVTYTCPITGKKRCAVQAALDAHPRQSAENLVE